mgnify:CR=1 FL=1
MAGDSTTLCVFGLGYVGLPTAVVFASRGFNVVGVDVDLGKVESVNRGVSYIKEPGLGELLREAVAGGRLRATADADEALSVCDVVLVDVPTPVRGGVADLSYVVDVLGRVSRRLRRGMLVVVESTVPPGTTAGLARRVLEEGSGLRVEVDFYLAHVPERIAPGRAVEELLNMPRVVGGVGPRSAEAAVGVYGRVSSRLYVTDATTAEFVKLAENAYRDLNIAFANLLALMAERLGIDVYEAIRLANTHPRVSIHMPGAGVGGPCLTKDPYMLASALQDFWGSELIRLGRRLNDYMPVHVIEIVERVAELEGFALRGSRVVVLGAAYKGGVDDTRESPARVVVSELLRRGADVVVHDPYTSESFGAKYVGDVYQAAEGADVVVVVTDHPEYRGIDLERLGVAMRRRVIVDGRRVIDPYVAVSKGFRYYGVGFGRAWRV